MASTKFDTLKFAKSLSRSANQCAVDIAQVDDRFYLCRRGSNRSFDSIMIDAFSKAYPDVVAEVKREEPAVDFESYDVPELNLRQVPLSEVLKCIYKKFIVEKHPLLKEEFMVNE